MTAIKSTLALAGAAIMVFALMSACNVIDESFDCAEVCDTYRDCVDETYPDVEDCTTRCIDLAGEDDEYGDQLNRCERCFANSSCDGTYYCQSECSGIVP